MYTGIYIYMHMIMVQYVYIYIYMYRPGAAKQEHRERGLLGDEAPPSVRMKEGRPAECRSSRGGRRHGRERERERERGREIEGERAGEREREREGEGDMTLSNQHHRTAVPS